MWYAHIQEKLKNSHGDLKRPPPKLTRAEDPCEGRSGPGAERGYTPLKAITNSSRRGMNSATFLRSFLIPDGKKEMERSRRVSVRSDHKDSIVLFMVDPELDVGLSTSANDGFVFAFRGRKCIGKFPPGCI
ncbi:hypothetical protein CEXT_96981 [Caerostris extrusa]|uniref:Uncharacterized protein n=1 Tax=Caerostris extrusa TaxID=172846 RepID=A0AAV4NNX1_CAEEX|nr:hypothetical protein CEXT_96981 [Caerostris extrusa]